MEENEQYLKDWLVQKLRRLSYQWPARKAALRKARVSRGKYICAACKEAELDVLYGPKEINVDHIDPVISVDLGFVDWNSYVSRLFCEESGFQILCLDHHNTKTFLENELRKDYKFQKKKDQKDAG